LGQALAFARVTDQCTDAGWCFMHTAILHCSRSGIIRQFECQIKEKIPEREYFYAGRP
jgi:hypothetical protein